MERVSKNIYYTIKIESFQGIDYLIAFLLEPNVVLRNNKSIAIAYNYYLLKIYLFNDKDELKIDRMCSTCANIEGSTTKESLAQVLNKLERTIKLLLFFILSVFHIATIQ